MVKQVSFTPKGDVVLEVGILGEEEAHILVSSEVLIKASSYFKAMLCGSFDEATHTRSPSDPLHIFYPEDDPRAMLTLSAILHGRYKDYEVQNIDHLEELAILCDYWDCASAVELHTAPLLERYKGSRAGEDDYLRVASIAWCLKQSTKYNEMILTCFYKYPEDGCRVAWEVSRAKKKGPANLLCYELIGKHILHLRLRDFSLPDQITAQMRTFRATLLGELYEIVAALIKNLYKLKEDDIRANRVDKNKFGFRYSFYLPVIVHTGIWPWNANRLLPLSIETIFSKLIDISDNHDLYFEWTFRQPSPIWRYLKYEISALKKELQGRCMKRCWPAPSVMFEKKASHHLRTLDLRVYGSCFPSKGSAHTTHHTFVEWWDTPQKTVRDD